MVRLPGKRLGGAASRENAENGQDWLGTMCSRGPDGRVCPGPSIQHAPVRDMELFPEADYLSRLSRCFGPNEVSRTSEVAVQRLIMLRIA